MKHVGGATVDHSRLSDRSLDEPVAISGAVKGPARPTSLLTA